MDAQHGESLGVFSVDNLRKTVDKRLELGILRAFVRIIAADPTPISGRVFQRSPRWRKVLLGSQNYGYRPHLIPIQAVDKITRHIPRICLCPHPSPYIYGTGSPKSPFLHISPASTTTTKESFILILKNNANTSNTLPWLNGSESTYRAEGVNRSCGSSPAM